ncbi:hypothetical protein CASFOL_024965 [Castilleja foliolosa]|uniref:Uncharacterized protein n=1 Tax=Castilleja foliolosa TaxID=1961234 RepID=A0ABD3CRP1_9LAMI
MYAFHLHFIFQKSGSLPNIPSLSSPFTALQVVGDLHGAFRRSISKEKKLLFSDSSRSAQRPARRPKNLECCSRLLICTSAGVIGSRHKPLQTSPKQINREELKSIEGLQLAPRSCKEVTDFVTANADPLIPTTKKARRSCHFWNWLCGGISCLKVSWICCCSWPSCPKIPSSCCYCCYCECDTCHSCGNPCAAGCYRMPTCGCWDSKCC